MGKLTTEIPYTELVERVMSVGRINTNAIEKVRGIIQDIYTRDIPTKHDWTFLYSSSAITTIEEYRTGTVSINTGTQGAGFSSDAVLIAGMAGRKIKFDGNEVVYDVNSFMGTTSLQILPPLQGASNVQAGGYTIYQPTYALAPDFDRFPKDGGIFKWTGGAKESLPEEPYQEYTENFTTSPSIPEKIRLTSVDTAGNQLFEFRPAPKDARVYSYNYLRRLNPMVETTAGFIKGISSNAVIVTGQTSTRFVEVGTDTNRRNFFRINALGESQDSLWFPVINIADDSALTLRVAFANTAVTTSAGYTLSGAPEIPVMLHPAILYGTLAHLMVDQNDPNAAVYMGRYAQVLSDSKRIFVSRTYSQDIHGIQEDWDYRR